MHRPLVLAVLSLQSPMRIPFLIALALGCSFLPAHAAYYWDLAVESAAYQYCSLQAGGLYAGRPQEHLRKAIENAPYREEKKNPRFEAAVVAYLSQNGCSGGRVSFPAPRSSVALPPAPVRPAVIPADSADGAGCGLSLSQIRRIVAGQRVVVFGSTCSMRWN